MILFNKKDILDFITLNQLRKKMQIAMSVIEIFQITPTLSSLNEVQRTHLSKYNKYIQDMDDFLE